MVRRIALVGALLCGIFWVASTVVMSYPDKFSGAERLTDAWRPVFTDDGLAQARQDIDRFAALSGPLADEVRQALAASVGLTPAEFAAFARANLPETTRDLDALDEIVPYFQAVVSGLEADQDEFLLADAVPTKDLPATVVPWLLIGLGLAVVGAAVAGLARAGWWPRSMAVAGTLGLLAVGASLALSLPAKARGVERLTDDFRATFSPDGVALARQHMDTVDRLTGAVTAAVPALPLGDLPGMLARFEGLVSTLESSADDFALTDAVPTKGLGTGVLEAHFAVPGTLLALTGGLGLLVPALGRRRHPAPTPSAPETEALAA